MQTTDTVLMVQPVAFGYNAQTAQNNHFQTNAENEDTQALALKEFDAFVAQLRENGIRVIVAEDTREPHTPDSIFPNNWVSFGEDGRVFLYPMYAPNRRDERRPEILKEVEEAGFAIREVIDLSLSENEGKYLEGTGSIIFDHDAKLAYGSVSERLDEGLFRDFCEKIGYRPVVFHSYQTAAGRRLPIYHTNVMMCVADRFVVICLGCIDDLSERDYVKNEIFQSGKEIIEISEDQVANFAGNMLQVHNPNGEKFLVMSNSAYQALTPEQCQNIRNYGGIIHADLQTIEKNGGGSARCMLAEVFLPKK